MWWYPCNQTETWTQTQRERRIPRHINIDTEGRGPCEAEIGVMRLQVKGCMRPPGVGRGKEGSSSRGFGGSRALPIPWFQTSLQIFWHAHVYSSFARNYWKLEATKMSCSKSMAKRFWNSYTCTLECVHWNGTIKGPDGGLQSQVSHCWKPGKVHFDEGKRPK